MMRVQGMMQHEVVSAPPDLSLAEALDLMQQHHIRHLPVVSGQQIIGLLTDRDIRQAMPSSATTLRLEEIAEQMETVAIATCMTVPVETVEAHTTAVEAARQLLESPFDCLPVVDQGRLVGMVTATDFLRRFLAAAIPAGEGLHVRDYMQTAPLTVAPSDIVRTAYHRMRCAHIRHLPVIATGRRLVGLLTDRDVRRLQASDISALTVYEQREPTYTLTVQEVMTRHVVTVEEDTPVADAGQRLLHHQIGCLPVVSSDGTLNGIVTVRDLIRAYVQQYESRR
jgi:acetoin utilization protein AcuB